VVTVVVANSSGGTVLSGDTFKDDGGMDVIAVFVSEFLIVSLVVLVPCPAVFLLRF